MNTLEYWEEGLANSFEEHGVSATTEQIKRIAEDVQVSHENIGLAFYTPSGPSPERQELDRVKEQLADEQRKIVCQECRGEGRIYTQGPYHCSNSECWKCRGEGRRLP